MDKLTEWIKAERGRLSKLATAMNVTASAVAQWDKVPAERIGQVSQVTGIPQQQLRPDLFEVASEVQAKGKAA